MTSDNCTLWNVLSGIIGLVVGSGGTFFMLKIRSKRRDSYDVTQRGISTGGGDVAGRDIRK